jgi:hypothetical protein
LEIEHKFIVDKPTLDRMMATLSPAGEDEGSVQQDTYYLPKAPGCIYRLRRTCTAGGLVSAELTVKSFGGTDTETRLEATVPLLWDADAGAQVEACQLLLAPAGLLWVGSLRKVTHLFEVDGCEVALYTASTPDKTIRCVEVEVKRLPGGGGTMAALAAQALATAECVLGLDPATRETKPLFTLLLGEQMIKELGLWALDARQEPPARGRML